MSLVNTESYAIEDRNIERLVNFLRETPKGVSYSTPQSKEDLEEVFKLRYSRYVDEGIIPENPSGLHLNLELLLPDCRTFLAKTEGKLIATISIVKDNSYGLAIDDYFSEEMNLLRSEGRKLAEVTAFASLPKLNGLRNVPFHLMNFTHKEGYLNEINNLVIKVQPKDKSVYQALWGFREFCKVVDYKTTRLMSLRNDIDENIKCFKKYQENENNGSISSLLSLREHEIEIFKQDSVHYVPSPEEIFYFLKLRTSTWQNTPENKKERFKQRYHEYYKDLRFLD
ncbi:MAG: hypothetical protein WC867_02665 [Candidatus Pacearchaeota archaeon]|jgi:hypothetical protein